MNAAPALTSFDEARTPCRRRADSSRAMLLFVYGSLLAGEENHALLAGSVLVHGAARTAPEHELVDLGPYPALLLGGVTSVRGEVYEIPVDTLAALDAFEGHPTLYERVWIRLAGGGRAAAYVLRQMDLTAGRQHIPDGDWRGRSRR